MLVTRSNDGQQWVYTYGGLISDAGTSKVTFRGDMWRYCATLTGDVNWQYVGCATGPNFVSDARLSYGESVTLATFCPSARARASLVAVGETLVLSGGVGVNGALDDIWRFDLVSEMWTLLSGQSQKTQPLAADVAIPPVLTGPVSARTMGSRYDHGCDAAPDSVMVYCYGGMTARGVYADIYRSAAPIALSRAVHLAKVADPSALFYPFRDVASDGATPGTVVSFLPRTLLTQAGLLSKMTLRGITYYLTRPVDARVSARVTIGVENVLNVPSGKLHEFVMSSITTKNLTFADFGTTSTEFTMPLELPITLSSNSVGIIVALEVIVLNIDGWSGLGSGGQIEESLAYGSFEPSNAAPDELTEFLVSRTKNTHFVTNSGLTYESALVPQMRLHVSPRGGGFTQGHASSSDLFSIDAVTGVVAALFAPPTGAAPSAAVLSKTLSLTGVIRAYASDPVIEDAELGYGAVWADTLDRDSDPSAPASYGVLPVTLPGLASHAFALVIDPTAQYAMQGIPAFTLYGGRWVQETPYETTMTSAVDRISGFTTFWAETNDATKPPSRYA